MRRIKILYIIGTLDVGGTEGQLVQLVTHLDPGRFKPVVFSLSSGGPHLSALAAAAIPAKVMGFRGFYRGFRIFLHFPKVMVQLSRLVHFMRQEQPTIVHGYLFWAYVIGTFAAKAAGVPIVIASRRGLGHFKANKPHYLFLERLANRMTDLIVANSDAVKQDVVRQEKVDPSKVRVIYNGVDTSLYEAQKADHRLKETLSIPKMAKVVTVVANFIHYKGHRFLLQACRDVKWKVPQVRFFLIGDGPLRREMEALAKELHVEEEVLFLGSRRDIPFLLAITDVAVLPSLEEGFPNAVLEAMAARKPVIATNVGGTPEAVVHGVTGLLVPPGDSRALSEAMLRLLENPEEAARFGEAGRRRVAERFEISAMVRQYEAAYEWLVAQKCLGRVQIELPAGGAVS